VTQCACGQDAHVFEDGRAECSGCYLRRVKQK